MLPSWCRGVFLRGGLITPLPIPGEVVAAEKEYVMITSPAVLPWTLQTNLLAALAYGAKGVRVFPVAQDSKTPCIPRADAPAYQELADLAPWQEIGKGGQHCAHSAEDAVRIMWLHNGGARIGCALEPGTIVIDLDHDGLAEHCPDLHGLLDSADTFVVATARGRHYYFTLPEGLTVTQAAGSALSRLPEHHPRRLIDLKVGGKGWTVLPPSTPYTHVGGDVARLAALPPQWSAVLLDEGNDDLSSEVPDGCGHVSIMPSTFTSGGGATVPDVTRGKLPEGTPRHPHLLAHAGRMRGMGCERPEIEAALLALNRRLFAVPKPEHLVRELARDVTERYEAGEAPDPVAAAAPTPEPEQPKRATVLDDFEEMCVGVGVRFSEAQPGGIHFAAWAGGERQKIGRVMYDRLRVALMDVPNSDRFTRRNNDLSALVHRACARHPFNDEIAVSSEWDALEGVMRASPPGRYRMADWIERAGALLRSQTGVVANRGALETEARQVARHLGMTALPPTSRYNVPTADGGWQAHTGSEQHRVWATPADWIEDGSHLRTLAA